MVPITRQANSFLVFFCMHVNRKEEDGETKQQQQTYQFTQGYNILHRLQIIHNKYMSTLYLGERSEPHTGVFNRDFT